MKSYFFILLFTFSAFNIKAQDNFINYGIKSGLNISTLQNKEPSLIGMTYLPRYAPHIGMFMNVRLNERFGLLQELCLSYQGVKSTEIDFFQMSKMNYLNFPILLDVRIIRGLHFYTGPQIGLRINEQQFSALTNLIDVFRVRAPEKPYDLAWNFGLKYSFNKWGIDARYFHGITTASQPFPRQYQRVFQTGLFLNLNSASN